MLFYFKDTYIHVCIYFIGIREYKMPFMVWGGYESVETDILNTQKPIKIIPQQILTL